MDILIERDCHTDKKTWSNSNHVDINYKAVKKPIAKQTAIMHLSLPLHSPDQTGMCLSHGSLHEEVGGDYFRAPVLPRDHATQDYHQGEPFQLISSLTFMVI